MGFAIDLMDNLKWSFYLSDIFFHFFKLTIFFQVQTNNYGSFYDDQRQTWSLMFDSEANAVQFAKQVRIQNSS